MKRFMVHGSGTTSKKILTLGFCVFGPHLFYHRSLVGFISVGKRRSGSEARLALAAVGHGTTKPTILFQQYLLMFIFIKF